MLSVIQLKDDFLEEIPLEQMSFSATKWINAKNPSQQELEKLSQMTLLPLNDLICFADPQELPRVTEIQNFTVIIIKCPYTKTKNASPLTTSMAFLVSEKLLITLHKNPIAAIHETKELENEKLKNIMQKGTGDLLLLLTEQIIRDYFRSLDQIELETEKIENAIFSPKKQVHVQDIFKCKRTLIYFHKGLSANREVLLRVRKDAANNISQSTAKKFDYIYNDTIQLIDVITTYHDILTGTLDMHLSNTSNNMNLVMKRMAAYGTIVLVPTFITGLYGMNFQFMPELLWKYGYLFAWSTIIFSVIMLTWYFKKKDWF